MKTYSTLIQADRLAIQRAYRDAVRMGSDSLHAAACAAKDGLGLTVAEWTAQDGTEAYAAALTHLVHSGTIKLAGEGS